jgi:HK97 family phage portal protein
MAYYGRNGGSGKTRAGTNINEKSAMTISALYAALNFIGGVVASLPLRVRRVLPAGGSEPAVDHPLYDRLRAKPNSSGLTAWQWTYSSLLHKYLWGNWWTAVERPNMELTPLLPDRTYIDIRQPELVHTRDNNSKEILLPRGDVLLIPHVSMTGATGKGIVHYARESLGLIKAQDNFASQFFGAGIKGGGFVEIASGMKEENRKGLQNDFNEMYGQLGESWKAIFLTGGAKWHPNELDASKAQALESRLFSVAEISRWTGLPPHLLHDLSRATFNNIEELDLALVVFVLTPIVTQIEQAMNVTFFSERERREYYVKFELKGLLRGNLQARSGFYKDMLDRGVFNADNVLELEDMNPQPIGLGQIYMAPLNMVNKRMILGTQPLQLKMAPPPLRDVTPKRARISAPGNIVFQRSSALRRKITIAYTKQWEAYAAQLLEEEIEAVRPGIEQWLGERSAGEFATWLDTLYLDFAKRIDELAAPLLSSYADAVLPIAQQEIGNDQDLEPQMQSFLSGAGGYRETFVRRHIKHSRGSLVTAVTDAEDPEAAAEEVLEDWLAARPERLRLHESIRSESAFARNVFVLGGIMMVRWVAYGKSCPYCLALDGMVVGIEEPFLSPGNFQPDGADKPLAVTSVRRHPPAHAGCDCGLEASF